MITYVYTSAPFFGASPFLQTKLQFVIFPLRPSLPLSVNDQKEPFPPLFSSLLFSLTTFTHITMLLSCVSNPRSFRALGRVASYQLPAAQQMNDGLVVRHFRPTMGKDKPLTTPLLETPNYMKEVALSYLFFSLFPFQKLTNPIKKKKKKKKVYSFWYGTEKNVPFLDKESVVNTLLWGHADLLEGTVVSMIKPGDRYSLFASIFL